MNGVARSPAAAQDGCHRSVADLVPRILSTLGPRAGCEPPTSSHTRSPRLERVWPRVATVHSRARVAFHQPGAIARRPASEKPDSNVVLTQIWTASTEIGRTPQIPPSKAIGEIACTWLTDSKNGVNFDPCHSMLCRSKPIDTISSVTLVESTHIGWLVAVIRPNWTQFDFWAAISDTECTRVYASVVGYPIARGS